MCDVLLLLLFIMPSVEPIRLRHSSTWDIHAMRCTGVVVTACQRYNDNIICTRLPPLSHYHWWARSRPRVFAFYLPRKGGNKSATIGRTPSRLGSVLRTYTYLIMILLPYAGTTPAVVTRCSPRRDTDCALTADHGRRLQIDGVYFLFFELRKIE